MKRRFSLRFLFGLMAFTAVASAIPGGGPDALAFAAVIAAIGFMQWRDFPA